MVVLVVHNYYQKPGGEDQVFADEVKLLRDHGHEVIEHKAHNDAVEQLGKLALAKKTHWNQQAYDEIRSLIRRHRPSIAHFHNTFPLLSPAVYHAAQDEGVRVVQTLHNYRLFCPVSTFFRDGHVCEDCLHAVVPWPAVLHACYRDNRPASAVAASMLVYHRLKRTWQDKVDIYIALTQFGLHKFVEGGLPEQKLIVKPHFVAEDPGEGGGQGDYAVFVGRLNEQKGIPTLLHAWQSFNPPLRLKILGDGPLRESVQTAAKENTAIEYLGHRNLSEVYSIVGDARLLIFCSESYETFGLTIVQAFARGTPVVASRIGGTPELVRDGVTGRLFEPGNPADLAAKVSEVAASQQSMRQNCRREFLDRYTAARNYPILMDAYSRALGATKEMTQEPAMKMSLL